MAQRPAVTLRVLPTPEALSSEVAAALLARLVSAQREGRTPAVGLTGGTIATAIHAHLGTAPDSALDWGRVSFWWGDERYVPVDSDERNDAAVLPVLRSRGVPAAHIHTMPAPDAAGLTAAAARYGAEWRAHGAAGFEVLMLGIGPDGHVASLFPGRSELSADHQGAVAVRDSPKPPPDRISLTLPTLNHTREVWFVASGAAKAEAVAAAQRPGGVEEVPARGVRGREATVWWLDTEAAALL